ncbi:MAG: phosphonate metabolism protein PhnM [bacterium]|nr:phosphonate metabolism protein PhnM [bacterium]
MKQSIINADIVLKDQVLKSETLIISDGHIESIGAESTENTSVHDLKGAYLLPGLIDLHCDAIERVIEPRAEVYFPIDFGIAQMDRINAAAGITTAYNAISFHDGDFGIRGSKMASRIVKAVKSLGNTLVDNRIHCRYEITEPRILESVIQLIDENQIDLLSFMDHTPGQGQFKDTIDYIKYQRRNIGFETDEIYDQLKIKIDNRRSSAERIARICDHAKKQSICLISHDDDTPQRVFELMELGVTISEFPINMETASEAKKQGVTTVFGAPNTLRGKSQSGSIRAVEAIAGRVADCLCSDYYPSTLISAVFMLPEEVCIPLPEAINMVTLNPARAVNLNDRGEISVGKVADLVSIRKIDNHFQVTSTWRQGAKVFSADYV